MDWISYRNLVIFYLVLHSTSASWLYLGQDLLNSRNHGAAGEDGSPNNSEPQRVEGRCLQQTRLLRGKVDACSQQNEELIGGIVRGAAMGLLECQWQFRLERWNCDLFGSDVDEFHGILLQGTREIAYLHAVTSASLVHSITSSCSAGLINDCTCDQSGHVVTSADDGWQWGGCSDNVDVGVKMSQEIIDHLDDVIIDVKTTTIPQIPWTTVTLRNGVFRTRPQWNFTTTTTSTTTISTTNDDPGKASTSTSNHTTHQRGTEGNYVISLSGSTKKKRFRRDDVIRSKGDHKRKNEMAGLSRNIKSLVNLHNNEVGRKTISSMMSHACRCHGVSGSCAVRTCWKALPDLRKVGDQLKLKYESSVEMSPLPANGRPKRRSSSSSSSSASSSSSSSSGQSRRSADPSLTALASLSPYLNPDTIGTASRLPFYLKRREKRKSKEPITDSELVFVQKSPNYCRQNSKKGVWGTKGRRCERSPGRPNSCQTLCCGRGFMTTVVRRREKCDCKFVWCCEVVCKECEVVEEVHTCK